MNILLSESRVREGYTQPVPSIQPSFGTEGEAKDNITPSTQPTPSYDIGVYGYQVNESLFNKIKDSVGYPVRKESQVLNYKPSWFADRSTVFYYDKSSKNFALLLANKLRSSTGLKFVVQYVSRENSISVRPGNEQQTFFIHVNEQEK